MSSIVLDTGALIALERRARSIAWRLTEARRLRIDVLIPAGCLAQTVRDPRGQVLLVRLLRQSSTSVIGFDEADGWAVGMMLARSGTADVVDAHAALVAERFGAPVVTSDPDDLRALDPTLDIVAI